MKMLKYYITLDRIYIIDVESLECIKCFRVIGSTDHVNSYIIYF